MQSSRNENKLTGKIEVSFSINPGQCIVIVSSNTLQQVEKFKYLGVVFKSCKRWNKETDTQIGKANTL